MPSNGIQVGITGEITPTALTDTFPVTNPYWGLGGLRTVADLTDRDSISVSRREAGMVVFLKSNLHYYKMESGLTNVDWTDLGLTLGGSSSVVTPITYNSLAALISNDLLVPGSFYNITDRADLGITVQAISANQLSKDAYGSFLVPDFQNEFGDNLGIWWSGLTGVVVKNIVIYYTYQYESLTGLVGTSPLTDTVNWKLIPKTTDHYVKEVDKISYDVTTDLITARYDRRANVIEYSPAVFQFGNDLVTNNTVKDVSYVMIVNQRGSFTYNSFSGASNFDTEGACFVDRSIVINSSITATNFNGNISYLSTFNSFINIDNSSSLTGILNCLVINSNIKINPIIDLNISSCNINRGPSILITFDRTATHTARQLDTVSSNFEVELDAAPIFSAGVLTLPTVLNYIGKFTLSNLTGQTITKIVNLPPSLRVRFFTKSPNTLTYTVTAVASAVANSIIGTVVGTTAIIGRTNGSDFMELEKTGTLNQRINVIKAL